MIFCFVISTGPAKLGSCAVVAISARSFMTETLLDFSVAPWSMTESLDGV